jgi:hypothetical protein
MPKARSAGRVGGGAYNAGTLWRMTRNGWTARCALWSFADSWELRVTVDDAELLFSKRGATVDELFSLAEQWKERMAQRGWTKITPAARFSATVA